MSGKTETGRGRAADGGGVVSLLKRVDWPFVRQYTGAIFMTALCLITFMFVAGASTSGPRAGAIDVLVMSLMNALPVAMIAGILAGAVLAVVSLRKSR